MADESRLPERIERVVRHIHDRAHCNCPKTALADILCADTRDYLRREIEAAVLMAYADGIVAARSGKAESVADLRARAAAKRKEG